MKIYICRKSISDLKNPIVKQEYETACVTVGDFIKDMVEKNYKRKPVKEKLSDCQALALSEFTDGSYYIVNQTKNKKYVSVDEAMQLSENDEIVLIKLKYVRGMIW